MKQTRRPEDEEQLNKTPETPAAADAPQEEPAYSLEEIMNEFGGWTKRARCCASGRYCCSCSPRRSSPARSVTMPRSFPPPCWGFCSCRPCAAMMCACPASLRCSGSASINTVCCFWRSAPSSPMRFSPWRRDARRSARSQASCCCLLCGAGTCCMMPAAARCAPSVIWTSPSPPSARKRPGTATTVSSAPPATRSSSPCSWKCRTRAAASCASGRR